MSTEQVNPDPGPDPDAPMQVGIVAERLGLSIRTLHHWDETGLVSPSDRSPGGFRLYTNNDFDRLLAVRRMKPLGFTLEEMKELLHSLDVLADPTADAMGHTTARAFLAMCQQRAQDSYATLQQRLGWADEFRHLLDDAVTCQNPSVSRQP